MNKALLDTDILSEIFKGINQQVIVKATAYRAVFGCYTTSVITVMEVVQGWHKRQREDKVQAFLATLATEDILILELPDAELAGRIYADLERTGQPIGYPDSMIAAIALQRNLTLVTGNLAHYSRIQALGYPLRLDNWRT
ncbi:type II toxin-antitoxin system VapC family toxin [Chlorogloeopsis sp. ULAP02]|uniref:type II toxin-antitoxin system VapC family toxin n=1 Tax=Chlorogloeopsis sp. ULAP02 TaxID=3107926 RepID=UPI00313676D1